MILTIDHLLGPYAKHPGLQSVVLLRNGVTTVEKVNAFLGLYVTQGNSLPKNPDTGSIISGQGNGGARPSDSPVGAPLSAHKDLCAVDVFDPKRALMRWILSYGLEEADKLGLFFEHPQWTRSWAHIQIYAPGSGNRFFVPYSDLKKFPPTCEALPEQKLAAVQEFPFQQPKKGMSDAKPRSE